MIRFLKKLPLVHVDPDVPDAVNENGKRPNDNSTAQQPLWWPMSINVKKKNVNQNKKLILF